MKCIYCKEGKTKVYTTAFADAIVVRHRQCLSCGKSFFTEERVGEHQTELKSMIYRIRDSKRKSKM